MTAGRARILVAVLAIAAFAPALWGEFLDLDDTRFIRDNEAIRQVAPARFLMDPSTQSDLGWEGTFRPLRTLDFAIDWGISGGHAWFFHLRSLLYHALASILVLAVLTHLLDGDRRAALAGAALFAIHPVQVESVAWITSRADVLVGCLFLGALLLHLREKIVAAAGLLALALLAKENAVVFPAIVILLHGARGERLPWLRIGVYGAVVVAFLVLRGAVVGLAGHVPWWGGSYGANLVMVARGVSLYAQHLVFPVGLAVDEHVPAVGGFDPGATLGILLVGIAVLAAVRGGPRTRIALGWFGLAILPTANLLVPVGIPTADRFLYLPLVGIALLVGGMLARRRVAYAVLACLLVLAFARTIDWRSHDDLMAANGDLETPRTLQWRAHHALDTDEEEAVGGPLEAIRAVDAYLRFYPERMGIPTDEFGGARALALKSNALNRLGWYEEALGAARDAVAMDGGAVAHWNAFHALLSLERVEEANEHLQQTLLHLEVRPLSHESGLRAHIAAFFNGQAAVALSAGNRPTAADLFGVSWRALPDATRNEPAARALGMVRR